MQQGHMLIDRRCCLHAAVAPSAVEVEGCDAMLTVNTLECGAAIHQFGCVISHILTSTCLGEGNMCPTLGQELSANGGAVPNPISALESTLSCESDHLEVNRLILSSSAAILT
jgi:hypothetical protein